MKLSDRKKKILQIVVDDYITTAQPVSSKSIAENHMQDVSSATVRSELATLEEMGYLTQLHTSSGRVPSVEAYKLYVAELMDKGKLTTKEVGFIKTSFLQNADNIEGVVKNVTKVISELTDYTSIALTEMHSEEKIKSVKMFRYKNDKALLLLATDNTLINDKLIDIPADMTEEQFENCNNLIADAFIGKQLDEVIVSGKEVYLHLEEYKELFIKVMDAIISYINDKDRRVYLDGEEKIFSHPEYDDADKVKNFLSVISSKEKLAGMLSRDDNIEISIKIGKECGEGVPEDCSMVTATYLAGGVKLGTYGVIGPVRMDYQKVVSVLEGVGKILENMLKDR